MSGTLWGEIWGLSFAVAHSAQGVTRFFHQKIGSTNLSFEYSQSFSILFTYGGVKNRENLWNN